ncbi:hypothetical protein RJ640_001226 [Escallonia rubra]|uniref:Uncharacterized protein n=1 Tax=Escallonia rubra TaxID=112253 RepID=A0AA88UAN8_9ASTE|nr:hypothetical protein RJ640_001226 [Escallonia rubra]
MWLTYPRTLTKAPDYVLVMILRVWNLWPTNPQTLRHLLGAMRNMGRMAMYFFTWLKKKGKEGSPNVGCTISKKGTWNCALAKGILGYDKNNRRLVVVGYAKVLFSKESSRALDMSEYSLKSVPDYRKTNNRGKKLGMQRRACIDDYNTRDDIAPSELMAKIAKNTEASSGGCEKWGRIGHVTGWLPSPLLPCFSGEILSYDETVRGSDVVGSGGGSGSGGRSGKFQYDPLSYALNFDEGPGQNGDLEGSEEDYRFQNFSSRYASMDLGKDGPASMEADYVVSCWIE